MKLDCNIKVKNNYKIINSIMQKLPQSINESIEKVLENIRTYAIKLEHSHNEEGILIELIDTSTNEVKGRVYTDKSNMPYALFEHFGTGEWAEMEHIGHTKHFLETGYTEWYIPINKVERRLNYPIKVINGKQFYVARGAKANHFMTDASFKTRQENKEIVEKKIRQMLEEVCK